MKKTLLAFALLSYMSAFAQHFETNPTDPAAKEQAAEDGDRMPTFMQASPKESPKLFRNWFQNAYLHEVKLYKKRNKKNYKYLKNDFQSIRVSFIIDTTGRPRLIGTEPELLSAIQSEVLHAVFNKCPSWTPAVQNGRKVRFKYTMPVIE